VHKLARTLRRISLVVKDNVEEQVKSEGFLLENPKSSEFTQYSPKPLRRSNAKGEKMSGVKFS